MNQTQPDAVNKTIEINNIEYSINEDDKTANIAKVHSMDNELTIPRSIQYGSQEYIITNVLPFSFRSFQGYHVKFNPDSEIRNIEPKAFYSSTVETIEIPSVNVLLKEGWCCNTKRLMNVKLHQDNILYKAIGSDIILGKSNTEQTHYDRLVFVSRSIKTLSIPNTIEIIDSYALNFCNSLQKVDFNEDSKLRIIGKKAFKKSGLKSISIPPQVTHICEGSFAHCQNLSDVLIPNDSRLQMIGKKSFINTLIKNLIIPSTCTNLHTKCFVGATNLTSVEVDSKNNRYLSIDNNIIIDKSNQKLVYCCNKENSIEIPNMVKIIGESAFYKNKKICSVTFPPDSKIEIIESRAFCDSEIESILIPSQISKIGHKAFYLCRKLKQIDIHKDSKIQKIEYRTFSKTSIEKISIPSQIIEICEEAFASCDNLHEVEISKDSKLQIIGKLSFYHTNIENFNLPLETIQLGEFAFSYCKNLHHIYISEDSKLKIICKQAFSNSKIEELFIPLNCEDLKEGWNSGLNNLKKITVHKNHKLYSTIDDQLLLCKSSNDKEDYDVIMLCIKNIKTLTIPKNVEIIGPYSFSYCHIDTINFPENSKLKTISFDSFSNSSIMSIKIPNHVTLIGERAFANCDLNEILFTDDSELQRIERRAFYFSTIKKISIPSSVTYIGPSSFESCGNLKHACINHDSQLKTICDFAFSLSSIEDFSLPSQITKINRGTFYSCSKLNNFYFQPDSKLQMIDEISFEMSNLQRFSVPSKVTVIEKSAFCGCGKLVKFETSIYSELERIEDLAIMGDFQMKKLSLPQKLKYFGYNLLKCQDLKEIKYGTKILHRSDKSFFFYPDLENASIVQFFNDNLLIVEFGPNTKVKFSDFDCCYHNFENTLLMVHTGKYVNNMK